MQKKSILFKYALVLLGIPLFFIVSCSSDKDTNGSEFIPYENFTDEITAISNQGSFSVNQFRELQKEHGRFFDLWLNEVLDFSKYGAINDTLKTYYLWDFIQANKKVFFAIDKHYKYYPDLQKDIAIAFKKLNEKIGEIDSPVLYSYFSQFSNYNTFVDTTKGKTILAFSSEMFMNDTFILYKILNVPDFFNRFNKTSQIQVMLLWNYLKARYENPAQGDKMINEAVFNGKIWYTIADILGKDKLAANLGYSSDEWSRMLREEGQIWRHYLNEDAIFSSDFNKYKRYFAYGNRTFGSGIPDDCPPLIGSFSGYRIVSAFMEKTGMSLNDLWKTKDANEILRKSGYNPLK